MSLVRGMSIFISNNNVVHSVHVTKSKTKNYRYLAKKK